MLGQEEEEGKRDVHSPFGIERGRWGSERRAGASISPKLSRVNGGRCRGREEEGREERNDSAPNI